MANYLNDAVNSQQAQSQQDFHQQRYNQTFAEHIQPRISLKRVNSSMIMSDDRQIHILDTHRFDLPFKIKIMTKNYGQACNICGKKIKIATGQHTPQFLQQKYCLGCLPKKDIPIGAIVDLRKVCFTVDWIKDFKFDLLEVMQVDKSYKTQKQYVENHSNTLSDSLKRYSKMDIRCSRCQYSQGQLYKFVEKTPNILIIHLNRFKRTKDDYVRFNNKINFPEDLSLSKITLNSDRANDSFQLYGLIGLRDNDVDREQWYSVYQKSKGVWVYCQSQLSVLLDLKDVKNHEVYMLFYRKVNVQGTLITTVL